MKKEILLYKVLLIAFISTLSFSSVNIPKSQDLILKTEYLENKLKLKKIKELAKKTYLIQKLREDIFKDFDYVRPDFYSVPSVK